MSSRQTTWLGAEASRDGRGGELGGLPVAEPDPHDGERSFHEQLLPGFMPLFPSPEPEGEVRLPSGHEGIFRVVPDTPRMQGVA
jgi:hypothetical protein